MHSYVCYCLQSLTTPKTYVGVTNNLQRRVRQHNQELVGGAKYTKTGGPWTVAILVGPFLTYQHALHFEWHWKHMKPKSLTGMKGRVCKLQSLLVNKIPWPLHVFVAAHITLPQQLPTHATQVDRLEDVL